MSSTDKEASVIVPPNAVSQAFTVTITTVTELVMRGPFGLASQGYEFGPAQVQLAAPVTLSIAAKTAPAAGNRVVLAYLGNNGLWSVVPNATFDARTNAVTGQVSSLGLYALLFVPVDGQGCASLANPDALCAPNACAHASDVCVAGGVGNATYSVGGNVSGLDGNLTLGMTGNLQVELNHNGHFVFNKAVARGQAFQVVVLEAPAHQSCLVQNGSGTAGPADISDVSVTCATHHYALGGVVAGLGAGAFTVANGNDTVSVMYPATSFTLPSLVAQNSWYTLTITAQPPGLECNVLNGIGQVGSGEVTVNVVCVPYLRFDPNQSAAVAIGQIDLVSNNQTADAVHTSAPKGTVFGSSSGLLYVPDFYNWRVLGFNTSPTQSGAPADFTLGQSAPSATKVGWYGTTPGAFNTYPNSVAGDDTHLLVSDSYTNRVLVFSPLPTVSNTAGVVAIGQPDLLTGGNPGCSMGSWNEPHDLATSHGKLLVADTLNHRVLVWNDIPTVSGTPPDLVLGQASFSQCSSNAGGSTSASSLYYPSGIWTDGTRVFIADTGNNRVLVWKTFPTVSGQVADAVIGQPDLSTGAGSAPQVGLSHPYGLTSDGSNIMVAEPEQNRISIWGPIDNAILKDVLGQPDTASVACNRGDTNTPPGPNTLCYPVAAAVVKNSLYVTDTHNNRVVVYQSR